MRRIYTLFMFFCLPLLVARLYWRSRKLPAYRERISERFARFTVPFEGSSLWIHTVSVGEFLSALPLIRRLQREYPNTPLVVTTTTPAASERVQHLLGSSVCHVYFPYDVPFIVRSFLQKIRPRLVIVLEREWWPTLFHELRVRKIPLFLAGARLSERAAKRYRWIRPLVTEMLNNVHTIAAQTEEDAARICEFDVPASKVHLGKNLKFDTTLPLDLEEKLSPWRSRCADRSLMWVAASTHPGEEEIVLAAHAIIRQQVPNALLILVPRHIERSSDLLKMVSDSGFSAALRTTSFDEKTLEVLIVNAMGELFLFYALAHSAFVGGSLVPMGCHNVLEPALLKKPLFFGPHIFNCQEPAEILLKEKAALQISDAKDLSEAVLYFHEHPEEAHAFGERAAAFVAKNQGALARHLELISLIVSDT